MSATEMESKATTTLKDFMTKPPLILMALSILILFPFYISVPSAVIAVGLIFWRYRRRLLKAVRSTGWFGVASVFSFVVAFANRNYFGILASVLFVLVWIWFVLYREFVTADLYLKLLNIIALGSIGTSLYAIYQYSTFVVQHQLSLDYILRDADPQHRAMSTLFNANYYGLFCIFALLMGAYLFVKATSRRAKGWYGLSMVLNLVGVLLTASRIALPALALGLITFVFFVNRRLVLWIGGLGLVGAAVVFLRPEFLARFTASSFSHSLEEREWIWGAAWRMFVANPLTGRGPMTYLSYFYLYEGKGQPHAHQLFLELLSSYGLYGMTLYALGTVTYFRHRLALWTRPNLQAEVGLLTAFLVAVLVHGLSDVAVMWLQTGYVFLFVMTCPVQVLEALAPLSAEQGYRHKE